ncbi:hypothetical protein B296_00054724, partial [Ensete ventricosum]
RPNIDFSIRNFPIKRRRRRGRLLRGLRNNRRRTKQRRLLANEPRAGARERSREEDDGVSLLQLRHPHLRPSRRLLLRHSPVSPDFSSLTIDFFDLHRRSTLILRFLVGEIIEVQFVFRSDPELLPETLGILTFVPLSKLFGETQAGGCHGVFFVTVELFVSLEEDNSLTSEYDTIGTSVKAAIVYLGTTLVKLICLATFLKVPENDSFDPYQELLKALIGFIDVAGLYFALTQLVHRNISQNHKFQAVGLGKKVMLFVGLLQILFCTDWHLFGWELED